MANPDYSAWQSDPESLLAFLDKNIIATGLLKNSKANSRPEFLALAKHPIPVTKDGKTVGDVWYLKQSDATTTADAMSAYICDYAKNETKYVMLGDQANFCFTITMNGCTFGIGSANSHGDVIVSHSNRASDPNQAVTQRDITLGGHKNGDVAMLEPAMYRLAPKMTCTTFGLRRNGKWKFYFQSYIPNGSTWDCFGTVPIETARMAR